MANRSRLTLVRTTERTVDLSREGSGRGGWAIPHSSMNEGPLAVRPRLTTGVPFLAGVLVRQA